MVALARQMLKHEWRRFLPAVLTVCFATMLLLIQAALVLGIFGRAAVYITASDGSVWAGYPGTPSVNLGNPIGGDVGILMAMDPEVTAVDPLLLVGDNWRTEHGRHVQVYVCGVNLRGHDLVFGNLLTPRLKRLLQQPGAVIVDRSDLDQLQAKVGSSGRINGYPVRIVAAISGLRALGGVNAIASLATASGLDHTAGYVTYWVAKLRHPDRAAEVARRLGHHANFGPYAVWTARDFARRSQLYWLLDTGAGAGVLFLAGIVLIAGIVIASQALMAVIGALLREFATLNALGVGFRSLRKVVLEVSAWVGGAGLALGGGASTVILWLARRNDVPVAMNLSIATVCALAVMLLALVSGMAATRALLRADPTILLR